MIVPAGTEVPQWASAPLRRLRLLSRSLRTATPAKLARPRQETALGGPALKHHNPHTLAGTLWKIAESVTRRQDDRLLAGGKGGRIARRHGEALRPHPVVKCIGIRNLDVQLEDRSIAEPRILKTWKIFQSNATLQAMSVCRFILNCAPEPRSRVLRADELMPVDHPEKRSSIGG